MPLDFRLHIYDMTHPPVPYKPPQNRRISQRMHGDIEGVDTTMKEIKTIRGHAGWWTITDSHLSPDNERYAHSVSFILNSDRARSLVYYRMIYSSHASAIPDSYPSHFPITSSFIGSNSLHG